MTSGASTSSYPSAARISDSPCFPQYTASLKCLEEFNSDKSKCQEHFDVYKEFGIRGIFSFFGYNRRVEILNLFPWEARDLVLADMKGGFLPRRDDRGNCGQLIFAERFYVYRSDLKQRTLIFKHFEEVTATILVPCPYWLITLRPNLDLDRIYRSIQFYIPAMKHGHFNLQACRHVGHILDTNTHMTQL
ncbi:cytochrome c oxidase-assembly factor COX23, mitochondrial [Senna tora]|uniref:Cytochrome c oxidase-assembly factor COX23, mitochondrial n=1 Tax=Senna tora TaxID=362788 RepID=A0A834TP36_9FABA|nr:cytochrome c oxidase-assembly factor COX23, mitochondrial [Senna tora]